MMTNGGGGGGGTMIDSARTSSSRQNNTRTTSIRVLVCSGNLGNARPDEASINAWLPDDGFIREVVSHPDTPTYPLPSASVQEHLWEELELERELPIYEAYEEDVDDPDASTHFDIICIGMQEATFDVPEDDPVVLIPLIQPLVFDALGKVASTVLDSGMSLAKSKDHIASENSGSFALRGRKNKNKKKKNGNNNKRPPFVVPALDDEADTKVLQQLILKRLPSYKFVVRFQRGEMRLEILVRKYCGISVETLRVKARNTGIGVDGILNAANKGGIVAELLVGGTTRISFCTAHLQAHEGKEHYKTRCKSVEAILEGTADEATLSKASSHNVRMDAASKSHVCFFLGDLNYRSDLQRGGRQVKNNNNNNNDDGTAPIPLDERQGSNNSGSSGGNFVSTIRQGVAKSPSAINSAIQKGFGGGPPSFVDQNDISATRRRSHSEESLSKQEHNDMVRALVDSEDWLELNKADELFAAIQRRDAFCGFETLPCFFPPTFKVERGPGFVYKDQRRPSYTDRILWKTVHHMEEAVKPMVYEPVVNFVTSDHKPVRGAFRIDLNNPILVRPQLAKRPSIFDGMGMSMRHILVRSASSDDNHNNMHNRRLGSRRRAQRRRQQSQQQRFINKTLHLRISNIECNIRPKSRPMDLSPDPYVSFISIPRQLVKAKVASWSKVKGFFRLGANLQLESRTDSHGEIHRTVHGFPRTKKLTSTYNPKWPEESVHLVVKQVDGKTGEPMDLGGALLMICVFDHLPSLDDNMIGCFPLNLAHLYEQVSLQQQQAITSSAIVGGGGAPPPPRGSRTISFRRDAWQNNDTGEHMTVRRFSPSLEEPCHTMLLKQPILKNGKQTGWIACTIDCYWKKPYDRIVVVAETGAAATATAAAHPRSEPVLRDTSSIST